MKKTLFPLFFLFFLLDAITIVAQNEWIAPAESNRLTNPLTGTQNDINTGKKVFQSLCTACHGDLGNGQGVAAAGLNPKPTNFTSSAFQDQSDGAIFWKLNTGKGVMASYEKMLSANDRWAIITYLRSLKPNTDTSGKKKMLN